jgi:hypothetical protein
MKTLKITTHWTADQADCVYQLLGELRSELWEHYGDEIVKMYEAIRVEQRQHEGRVEVNHELRF